MGAGKSEALAAFARHGAATLSADEVVHALYADPEVAGEVVRRFGPDVLDTMGAVDRRELGRRAFAEADGIAFLERLLHPRVAARRRAWVEEQAAREPPPPLLVCEVPLLFESGSQDAFDLVAVVTAPERVRRARVEARGQAFAARRDRQWDEWAKVDAADLSFVNDGDLDALDGWAASVVAAHGRPSAR